MTTIIQPHPQDTLAIAVELTRGHSGHWLGVVARRFGLDYDRRAIQNYQLGGLRSLGYLVGMQAGLVVVDPSPEHQLVSHRGLLVRSGDFFTTMMFVPAPERSLTITPGPERTLPTAAAVIKCTGRPTAIALGLSASQWADLNRWLDFWLPE